MTCISILCLQINMWICAACCNLVYSVFFFLGFSTFWAICNLLSARFLNSMLLFPSLPFCLLDHIRSPLLLLLLLFKRKFRILFFCANFKILMISLLSFPCWFEVEILKKNLIKMHAMADDSSPLTHSVRTVSHPTPTPLPPPKKKKKLKKNVGKSMIEIIWLKNILSLA